MLGQILLEMLIQLFVPSIRRPDPPPAEGEYNASLGSIAAFLALLAVLFSVPLALIVVVKSRLDPDMMWMFGISAVFAILGITAAYGTFRVTWRRHTLARAALWSSWFALAVVVIITITFLVDTVFYGGSLKPHNTCG